MNGTNLFKIALRALVQQQATRFPHHVGDHHRCGISHCYACHRTRLEKEHTTTNIGDGVEHDHDSSGSRNAWRCPPGPFGHADTETGKLRKVARRVYYLSGISPNVSSSGQLVGGQQLSVFGEWCKYGLSEIRQLTVEQGEMFTEMTSVRRQGLCYR